MVEHEEYTIEDIERYLDENLFFMGRSTEVDETYEQVKTLLSTMPYEFQRVIMEQKTKFVHCDARTYDKTFKDRSRATSVANEIYFPELTTLDSLRHEIGHVAEKGALRDHPGARPNALLIKGLYTEKTYSEFSDIWKAAVGAEVSDKDHFTGFGWFKKFKDILYSGDESAVEYLKHTKNDPASEAFAEITRKYLTLFDHYSGDFGVVDSLLSQQYPKLWPVYRDDAIPEMNKSPTELLQNRYANYDAALHSSGGAIVAITKRSGVIKYADLKPYSLESSSTKEHVIA